MTIGELELRQRAGAATSAVEGRSRGSVGTVSSLRSNAQLVVGTLEKVRADLASACHAVGARGREMIQAGDDERLVQQMVALVALLGQARNDATSICCEVLDRSARRRAG